MNLQTFSILLSDVLRAVLTSNLLVQFKFAFFPFFSSVVLEQICANRCAMKDYILLLAAVSFTPVVLPLCSRQAFLQLFYKQTKSFKDGSHIDRQVTHRGQQLNLIVFIDVLGCREEIPAEVNKTKCAAWQNSFRAKPDRFGVKASSDH